MLVIRVNAYKNERIYIAFYWMKKHKYTTTFTPINHTWNQLKETKTGNYEFTSVEETASPLKYLLIIENYRVN